MTRALVTGVTGQDGHYISKLLLEKGYEVYGFLREGQQVPFVDIKSLYGEMHTPLDVQNAVREAEPDEIYNCAAISDIGTSIQHPEETMKVNCEAVGILLKCAAEVNPKFRFCQASSREIFSPNNPPPQNEQSEYGPSNPYGVAKLKAYTEYMLPFRAHGYFVSSAIFNNHESPFRGDTFVTKKIVSTLSKISKGEAEILELGNLRSKRDWGFAGDYVEAMWMMLQQDTPDDFVIATGVPHTVRDFVHTTARAMDMKLLWEGEAEAEIAKDEQGIIRVRVNPAFYRPLEQFDAIGDSTKARKVLGWYPKTSFEELIAMMVNAEKTIK